MEKTYSYYKIKAEDQEKLDNLLKENNIDNRKFEYSLEVLAEDIAEQSMNESILYSTDKEEDIDSAAGFVYDMMNTEEFYKELYVYYEGWEFSKATRNKEE